MAGTLEPVPKGFMTPKEQIKGYTKPASTEYSAARSVKDSPFERLPVKTQAELQSSREDFEKKMLLAAREKKGGKSRRRKSKKSKKSKRRHIK